MISMSDPVYLISVETLRGLNLSTVRACLLCPIASYLIVYRAVYFRSVQSLRHRQSNEDCSRSTPQVSGTAFLVVPVHINACPGLTSRLSQIYDYLLMLGSEVQYVWHVNWGAGKVLYLLSRYPLLVASAVALHSTLLLE